MASEKQTSRKDPVEQAAKEAGELAVAREREVGTLADREDELREDAQRGRRHAIATVDEAGEDVGGAAGVSKRGEERSWHRGKTFTALHPILRGEGDTVTTLYPNDEVRFGADEGIHVRDLLAAGSIAEGSPGSADVKRKLADADRARAANMRLSDLP